MIAHAWQTLTTLPVWVDVCVGACAGVLLLLYRWSKPRYYYFVRHGQTLLNKAQIKQGEEGGLSEAGKAQAEEVGTALEPTHIRLICSSPYERAKETSAIIAKHLPNARIRYSPLLVERRNPSDVIGKSTHDPEVMRIVDGIDLAYHEDAYRYKDEENFLDLKARAKKCLRYLERQYGHEICVVTHHAFLKMILSYMLYQERFNAQDFIKLSFFNPSDNGGITVCEYHPLTRRWVIVGYNETAAR